MEGRAQFPCQMLRAPPVPALQPPSRQLSALRGQGRAGWLWASYRIILFPGERVGKEPSRGSKLQPGVVWLHQLRLLAPRVEQGPRFLVHPRWMPTGSGQGQAPAGMSPGAGLVPCSTRCASYLPKGWPPPGAHLRPRDGSALCRHHGTVLVGPAQRQGERDGQPGQRGQE